MRKHGVLMCVLLVAALAPSSLSAQTTGRIEGRVVDETAAALPGVTVAASSENLQGEKLAVTDVAGTFRLLNLPPGNYTVIARLDGYNTLEQQNVRVGIDRTVSLEMVMNSAFAGQITVTSEAPVVDISSTDRGVNVSSETFQQIPLARDFYAVAQVAPGTGEDDFGTTVFGSTSAENQYVIDGLNTTGVELGIEAKTLNFEFIEEVEAKTGGLPAEYGRMTGGVINAITKSGGNEFKGDVFGYFEGGGLQSDDTTANQRPEDTTTVFNVDSRQDFGLALGGYFGKDKVWFFAAYDSIDETQEIEVIRDLVFPGSPSVGSVIDTDTSQDLYAGKLTWRINDTNSLSFTLMGDPADREGAVFDVRGPDTTWRGALEAGANDLVARWDGVFGGSWVLEGLAGRHSEETDISGPGKSMPGIEDRRFSTRPRSGGFWFHQDTEFDRDVLKLDVSRFVGDHEFKFGGDIEEISAVNANWNGGAGQRIYVFDEDGVTYYRHRYYVNDLAAGYDRDDPSTWELLAPLVSEPSTDNTSLYAQDAWQVSPNVSVNLGLRWERQEVNDRFGVTSIDLDDNWAPRVGFTWDVQNNGRSKLYGFGGRYYESIPMDINIRAFGGEVQAFSYNFDFDSILSDPDAPRRSSLLGGQEPVDPDLEGQYIDEYLLGYEYEIRPNLAVGVQAMYRDLGQVIEDFLLLETGDYAIANPGSGTFGQELTFYDYYYYYLFPEGYPLTAPAPKAEREYTAVEISARKRFSNNWQMITSYVWSELEGNYDGLYQASTGQLDPNINSAYDYADFLVNAYGRLTNDRQHQLKFSGSYRFSQGWAEGLNLGVRAFWLSGAPQTAYGYSFGYENNEFYLTPRGSLGDGPDFYEMDLHLSYPVSIGGDYKLNLLLDVFNLLDRQAIIARDQRYNRPQDDFCAGIPDSLCSTMGGMDHIPGTTDPVGALPDPRSNSPNPDFLRGGAQFSGQRSIRLGVRFSF